MANAIVVGAGPVGLMLAGELRLGGVDVVVYDKLPAPSGESRALGFTRRTAEVLDQRGLLTRFGEFRWGRAVQFAGVHIDSGLLRDNHFGVLGLPQARTEEVLGGWLAELGVPVRRGFEVVDLRETEDGVVVVFDGPDGRGEDSAEYVVGCDGPQSIVRGSAGIGFPGLPPARTTYMADLIGAGVRPRPTGERVAGGIALSVPLGRGVDRIVIVEESLRPRPADGVVTFAEIADTWQRMTGESLHHAEVRWMAAPLNVTGQATAYRRGRVLLAGDAAHDHPAIGAQGLSAGVQDAVNLGWKLAATINGSAPAGLLDTYHSERHPVGQQLLRNMLAHPLLLFGDEEMEPLRSILGEVAQIRGGAEHLAGLMSGLAIRYDVGASGHPMLGLRLSPDQELQLAGGTRTRVADLLHPARGVLIGTGPAGEVRELAAGWADRVDVATGRWVTADANADRPGLPDAVLVRPDGYVAWAAPGGGDLQDALERWFGAATARLPEDAAALAPART